MDGGYHSEYEQIEKDENRTQRLNDRGFNVIRFKNEDILKDTEIEKVLLHKKEGTYEVILNSLELLPLKVVEQLNEFFLFCKVHPRLFQNVLIGKLSL